MDSVKFLRHFVIAGFVMMVMTPVAESQGMKGRLGIGGFAAEAVPLGVEELRDRGDIGHDFGGTLRFGVSEQWAVGASYENMYLQNGIRREPLTLSAVYYQNVNKTWSPVGEFGIGAAASDSGGPFTNLSFKAGIGVELFAAKSFSFGPQLNFHYITATGKAPFRSIVMAPGLIAMFYFGGEPKTEAQPTPQAAPAATAIPVLYTIGPAQATLRAGQSQAFQVNASGLNNNATQWTIEPRLGTISEAGVYEAPSKIEFAQSVRVIARSLADTSRAAVATLQLVPESTAPQQVSIKLEIYFDTGKDVVKSSFDPELTKVAMFLQSYPATSAQIEGHSDNTGNAEFNKTLSQRRADSVKNALVAKMGIDASRLTAVGYGQEQPIADNSTAAGRAQNRRVVAVVRGSAQQQ